MQTEGCCSSDRPERCGCLSFNPNNLFTKCSEPCEGQFVGHMSHRYLRKALEGGEGLDAPNAIWSNTFQTISLA